MISKNSFGPGFVIRAVYTAKIGNNRYASKLSRSYAGEGDTQQKKAHAELFCLSVTESEHVTKDAERDYWMTSDEAKKYGIIDEIYKSR